MLGPHFCLFVQGALEDHVDDASEAAEQLENLSICDPASDSKVGILNPLHLMSRDKLHWSEVLNRKGKRRADKQKRY